MVGHEAYTGVVHFMWIIDSLFHCRQYGRHKQYECQRRMIVLKCVQLTSDILMICGLIANRDSVDNFIGRVQRLVTAIAVLR